MEKIQNAFNLGTNFNIIVLNNPENLNSLRHEIKMEMPKDL